MGSNTKYHKWGYYHRVYIKSIFDKIKFLKLIFNI